MGASGTRRGWKFGLGLLSSGSVACVQAGWQVYPGEEEAPVTLVSGQSEQVRPLHWEQRKE